MSDKTDKYDKALEAFRDDPSDKNRATKDKLAQDVVAERQAERQQREAEVPGDGQARPAPVDSTSEVSQ